MDSLNLPQSGTAPQEAARPVLQDQISVGEIRDSKGVAIGTGATVIINEALSFAEQARQQQAFEREELARSVARLASDLRSLALTPISPGDSPYKHLLAYNLSDAAQFFGREEEVSRLMEELTGRESLGRLVVLHGEAGIGKTSLLKAGLAAQLIIEHHLPLIVPVTGEPLVEAVKGILLTDLDITPQLKRVSLREFMRQVGNLLPMGKRVCVLLDGFEAFFNQPSEARQRFVEELEKCLNDEIGRHSWLISIRSSRVGDLSAFQPTIKQPLAKTVSVPALSREEARAAILEPARQTGYELEEPLVEAILEDLGEDLIDPSSLQMVCHTLVDRLPEGEKRLALADYEQAGLANGILSRYLDLILVRNLTPQDRETSWRLLAGLAERRGMGPTLTELKAHMWTYNVSPDETSRVLDLMVENRLVQPSGERYGLAHPVLRERVRQWAARQAALEQARQEARRQVERMRRSALRGLLGGGLGFMLAYALAYSRQWPGPLLIYLSFQRALPGAIAGLLVILFVDLALASYHGERRWLRWPTGALAGAAAFSLVIAYHGMLVRPPYLFTSALPGLLVQGGLWGLAAGLGTVWARLAKRPAWQILPIVALAGGLTLWLGEGLGNAFEVPKPTWIVALAGAVLPVFIAASARLGRPIDADE